MKQKDPLSRGAGLSRNVEVSVNTVSPRKAVRK